MRKSRFSEGQIIGTVKEAEAGRAMEDLRRDQRISRETFYRWPGGWPAASTRQGPPASSASLPIRFRRTMGQLMN